MTAPEIPDTQSPFWLRMYGHWMHLEGVVPETETTQGRGFSELITVDGYRYVQRAPRGPRTWTFNFEYATAAATAAMESVAYDIIQTEAASGRTLLLDTNQAKVNMVRPEITTQPKASVTYQQMSSTTLQPIRAGGVWLPSIEHLPSGDPEYDTIPVRSGITYTAAVWTTAASGEDVLVLDTAAGNVIGTAVGGGTITDPELVDVTWTAPGDEDIRVYGQVGAFSDTFSTAGLMFFEGDCPPETYRRGRRMPVEVAVQDPSMTSNFAWPYPDCDPCALPRESTSFVVQEIGTFPSEEAEVA